MPLIASAECGRFQADVSARISMLIKEQVISCAPANDGSPAKLQLSGWHRVAVLTPEESSHGLQVHDATFVGWHAFISHADTISHLVTMTQEGEVAAVLRGQSLERLRDALIHAEQTKAVQKSYEPIYLRINRGETDVLWLRSPSDDDPGWVIPLGADRKDTTARRSFSALRPEAFLKSLPRQPT